MSDFSGYEKMPKSLKKLGLSERAYNHLEKLEWVVTEKIHGANFSFIYEDGQLRFAKRKEYLSWDADFFGFQWMVHQLESRVMRLFEAWSSKEPGMRYMIYGELFGGAYPHPDVPANESLQAVQTGVYYSPDLCFSAFDMAWVQEDETKTYLDYDTAISYFEKYDLMYAQPLFIGDLSKASTWDIQCNSTIPELLDLPKLQENIMEGIVIKPFGPINNEIVKSRPIFKIKNKEFDEEIQFHEAQHWSFIPDVTSQSEELNFIVEEIRKYINENRLESAISKIGGLDFTQPDRIDDIRTEFLQDVILDFNINSGHLLDELNTENQQWIQERIISQINKLLKARQPFSSQ